MKSHSRVSALITGENRKISSKALFACAFYLILPTAAILTVIGTYPELSSQRLMGILYRIVPIAFILILISQFQVRYTKGSLGRFTLNEIYVLLVLAWVFALLGGEPVVHQTWNEYEFSLHIWNYLLLIIFITAVNVLYYALEFAAFKEDVTYHGHEDMDEGTVNDGGKTDHGVVVTTIQASNG